MSRAYARQGAVSTALVLAADISDSVNQERFELQRKGYAKALVDPRVYHAIRESALGCVGLCYFEWAGARQKRVLIPWTVVRHTEDGERLAEMLESAPRPFEGSTDLGAAIRFAVDQLAEAPFAANEQVLDISGDGLPSDDDGPPDAARDLALAQGVRINALALSDASPRYPGQPDLPEYFEQHVMGGPRSFVVEADSYESFGAALAAKIRMEIT